MSLNWEICLPAPALPEFSLYVGGNRDHQRERVVAPRPPYVLPPGIWRTRESYTPWAVTGAWISNAVDDNRISNAVGERDQLPCTHDQQHDITVNG